MKIYKILSISLIALIFQSCFVGKAIETPKMKSEFSIENDAIPSDFARNGETILVQLQGRGSYDRYLKKAFKKNYAGPYEFVEADAPLPSEYDNKKVYRYIFDYDGGTTRTTTFSNGRSATSTYKRFFVQDRLNDKKYQSGAEFTFFAKAMKVYVENLETIRTTNTN